MPYIENIISDKITDVQINKLNEQIAGTLMEITGKSKNSIMNSFIKAEKVYFGDNSQKIAYVHIKYLGEFTKEQKNEITLKIGNIYEKVVDFEKGNIYINFTKYERGDWGYNGKTF